MPQHHHRPPLPPPPPPRTAGQPSPTSCTRRFAASWESPTAGLFGEPPPPPPSVSAYQERDEWLKINICPPARRLKKEALATLIRRYKYAPNLTVHVQDIRGLTALIHAISVGAACNVPRLYITTIMASHCILRKSFMVALANALHQEGGGLPMARAIDITYVHKWELGAKEIFIRALGNAASNLSP